MIYCFDIDGTLCTQTPDSKRIPYNEAQPFKDRIEYVNRLYDDGNIIILFTARGSSSGVDWREFTKEQMVGWGVKYHKLIFGKPDADLFVDDKAINHNDFFGGR